jgi:MFS family permease
MDMYLPSTPTIAASLHASQSLVQLTLSGCLAGLAVGQLVAGPLSDGLGRKRPRELTCRKRTPAVRRPRPAGKMSHHEC